MKTPKVEILALTQLGNFVLYFKRFIFMFISYIHAQPLFFICATRFISGPKFNNINAAGNKT